MKKQTRQSVSAACTSALLFLTACQAPGSMSRADTYTAAQVNTRQAAKVVTILAVTPANVQVDNSQNQRAAQIGGALLGGIGGGILGSSVRSLGTSRTLVGVAGGGAAGALAGSLVPGEAMVEGVSITYDDQGQTFSSAQVGRSCEFIPGHAIVVSTSAMETRIQPNSSCPASKA